MHLTRTDDHTAAIEALPDRVGLDSVWGDLDRRLRRTFAPGRAVRRAWTWQGADRSDPQWWPQGICVVPGGRRLAVSWYAKTGGSRVSFLDLDARRYRHVSLVVPTAGGLAPLKVHAGGIALHGRLLYVAATKAGLWVCDTDDVVRGPEGYVLPVNHRLAASEPFRFSFVGLSGDDLVVGEYDNAQGTKRLAHVGLDGGPREVIEAGIARAQGAVRVGECWYVTASQGARKLGSIWSGPAGALREHRYAVPMGPEDLAHDPATDRLWTVTEHPRRRWVIALDRARLS